MQMMYIQFFLFTLISVTVAGEKYTDEEIEAFIAAKCRLVCDGELDDERFKRVCTCDSYRGTFIYGKRNSAMPNPQPAYREFQMSELPEKEGEDRDRKVADKQTELKTPVNKSELLKLLSGFGKERSDDSKTLVPKYLPIETSGDIGDALEQLLSEKSKPVNLAKQPNSWRGWATEEPTSGVEEAARKLFKEDMGVDISLATRDDFLNWVEKEMKAAEQRLMKLLKFYQFILATSDSK